MINNDAVDQLEELVEQVLDTEDCCDSCTAVAIVSKLLRNKDLFALAVLIDGYNKGHNGLEQC